MKIRTIFLVFICFISIVCSAQSDVMKFVGVPMDQSYRSFIEQLKEKGFTYCSKQEKWNLVGYKCISLTGDFWKFKDCRIRVKYSIATDTVASVAVQQDYFSIWYSEVYELMDNFDIKYGTRIKTKVDKYNTEFRWISNDPSGMVSVSWCLMDNILDLFTIEYFTSR